MMLLVKKTEKGNIIQHLGGDFKLGEWEQTSRRYKTRCYAYVTNVPARASLHCRDAACPGPTKVAQSKTGYFIHFVLSFIKLLSK